MDPDFPQYKTQNTTGPVAQIMVAMFVRKYRFFLIFSMFLSLLFVMRARYADSPEVIYITRQDHKKQPMAAAIDEVLIEDTDIGVRSDKTIVDQLEYDYSPRSEAVEGASEIELSQEVPPSIPEEIPEEIHQEIPEEIPQGTPPSIPQEIPQEIPNTKEKQLETRLKILQNSCQGTTEMSDLNELSGFIKDKIHVQDDYKMIYCLVPKVGCTSMKRLFINISDHGENAAAVAKIFPHSERTMTKAGIHPLTYYTGGNLTSRVTNFTKVIIIRHPLIRLLSAYRNKFVEDNPVYPKHLGTKIIARYRKDASNESLVTGQDVRYSEFVQFLIDSGKEGKKFDMHWAPYTELCDPCHVKYDIVMKLETMDSDMEYIKNMVYGGQDYATIPKQYSTVTQIETMKEYYADVTDQQLLDLSDIYRDDFTMYGYGFKLEDAIQAMQGFVV